MAALDKAQTPEQADAWQAAESKPLYAEVVLLDKDIAAATKRKREIRDELYAIEQQAAARRAELATDAGPDQIIGG